MSAFTAHPITMGAFRKTIATKVSWIGLGVFLLPTLVLSMLARWQLAASIRETSALLLGVAVYFAYMLLGHFLNLRFSYPEVTPYLGWVNSALLTMTLGASGIVLAACAARWLRPATV
ncbi:hypothetical protein [Paraburkholderia terrae]|nr:hypothetical protein [Paraburkholderia terrae]